MIISAGLLGIATVLLLVLFEWRRKHFAYFKNLGVPGPKPNLLWGNLREYYQEDRYKVIGKWLKKYGDVFGFYYGDVPFLVVNDLEFLEYVFVRNFRNFVDRGMMPEIRKSADLFLERLDAVADEQVHSYQEYQLLSMDYTARGAFGIDTVFQREPNHPLLLIAKGVLDGVMTGPLHMIAQSTTALGILMVPFYWLVALFGEFTFKTLGKETSKIVELRRRNPSAHMDYETLTWKLPYLGQVINEALRLYPPVVLFVTRKAVTDFEYNGLKYKAGTCIMSPTLQIHRDARYWPQPLTFNPDRFSPENEGRFHKVAHHPFGIGPRNCVGMRMALLQLNCTIARLVQGFRLELGPPQREDFLDIHSCAVVSKPTHGPWIVFRRL
ncbi:hypothetical protein V5799_030329 [Amblyomma americanum]|uniref:Cytochrome n=1 Tax=Amblyomma americanum TaxID=6943 RepID=A0AAQ4EP36_AMBAM